MNTFKKFGGERINNLDEYIKELLEEDSSLTFALGADSHQYKKYTSYAVALVIHSSLFRRGAHVLFFRNRTKRKSNLVQRLWHEAEILFNEAENVHKILEDCGYTRPDKEDYFKMVDLHIDLNPDPLCKSNRVYMGVKPWFEGMGYKTIAKPDAFGASVAADLMCK